MKKSRFTEIQIVDALKRHENGLSVADLARELGITPATFYAWRKKYAGMDATHLKRLKELEAENAKLKKMYAELALDNVALKDVVSKKW
jgi:putative transposase